MENKLFDWTLFFDLLDNKEIIPVVGNEIIRISHKNKLISLYDYLAVQLIEKQDLEGPYNSLAELFEANHSNPRLRTYIRSILKNINPEQIDTSYVVKLAKISNFNTYICTAFDGLLGEILEKVRPEDFPNFKIINYSLNGAEILKDTVSKDSFVIFNLFGTIQGGDYAKSEEELLEYCYNYALDQNMQFNLSSVFKNKHPLFIGNSFPFWLQLFLIRMITGEAFSKSDIIKFIAENNTNDSNRLRSFLAKYNTEFFVSETDSSQNMFDFIDLLYNQWVENNAKKIQKQYKGTVFLSFNSADREYAHSIWKKLTEKGVSTFYDEEIMKAGSVYDKKIMKQIKTCTYFVPFISENSINDSTKYVYSIEWKAAEARRMFLEEDSTDSFIRPYILDNTNFLDSRIPDTFRKLTIAKISERDMVDDIIGFLEPIKSNA